MKIGKAKYSGERKEVFKMKDGDNLFRILPPMGALADKGVWSVYYRVVWGYKDTNGRVRPFVSPRQQNFKTKMIEVDCAAYNRSEALKARKESLKKQAKQLMSAGAPVPEAVKNELKQLDESIKRFNIDSKHHVNAMTQDSKIGLLKLAGRAMTALRAEIKKLQGEGVDPLSVEEGRFMNFNRSGSALETAYQVTESKVKVKTAEYGIVEKSEPHTLTESVLNRLGDEAYELSSMYPMPSAAQVKEIVEAYERSELEGAQVLERVLGTSSGSAAPVEEGDDEEQQAEQPKVEATPAPKQEAPKAAPAQVPASKEEPKAAAPKQEQALDPNSMSDDDFLKLMGA